VKPTGVKAASVTVTLGEKARSLRPLDVVADHDAPAKV
jgi:hypothetical protein